MTSTTTIEETGWTRVNGNVMRWVQPLRPEHGEDGPGRLVAELKGGRDPATGNRVVLLSVGSAEFDQDLSDEKFWKWDLDGFVALPEDAARVLWHALGSALKAMNEQAATATPTKETPA